VSSKLSLPAPDERVRRREWSYRRTDLDPFGHVNNAAQWAPLEEIVQMRGLRRRGVAELEYLAPVDVTGECELLVDDAEARGGGVVSTWLRCDDRVAAATRWLET
jgi:acyl-ACP thioesterase